MSSKLKWVGLLAGAALTGAVAQSAAPADDEKPPTPSVTEVKDGNPYSVIVAGNAFRLNPPPPPPVAPGPPPPDLPKVIFSGTVTIGPVTKAMFAVKTKEPGIAKGPASENTEYISLTEGETTGPVHLLKILPGGEKVEIENSGTKVSMSLAADGYEKSIPAGGGGGLPGMRGAPGGPIMPVGAPGQPNGQVAVNEGINVGGQGTSYGGGITVGGSGGNAFSSANRQVNANAVANTFQQVTPGGIPSAQFNTGGVKLGGGTQIANSIPTPPSYNNPNSGIAIPMGNATIPQANSTPPATTGYKGPMPPMPTAQ